MPNTPHDLVVVANRLPVDVKLADDGSVTWRRSPGGLVTALAPLMQQRGGAWVGWAGAPDLALDPFDADGTWLVPVTLTPEEVRDYYEGFSNDTLWPLCHDVITPPAFHRQWWDAYRSVNELFASLADYAAAPGATVWVHDYQLQLVPSLLRAARPDLTIGYFHHIPFPPLEIFSQLPWRRQVLEGLLGADLVGFQRTGDAANFLRSVRRLTDHSTSGQTIFLDDPEGRVERRVRAASFPISIASSTFSDLAHSDAVRARATKIRQELGNPKTVFLGVDRLDYTKGILHRVKAFGEVLADGTLNPDDVTLVQVASPSRENVDAYQQLRDDLEGLVGRINGDFGGLGHQPIAYLHQGYPAEEMAALYQAADVMLVTSLRDGMNLVAKEYVAARWEGTGVLVLSEFTGAADELHAGALMINPHDIDGVKAAIVRAATMPVKEQRSRMRRMRRRVMADDVDAWSTSFLQALDEVARNQPVADTLPKAGSLGVGLARQLTALSQAPRPVLVASDFDGVLAPLVDDPMSSAPIPAAAAALDRLAALPHTDAVLAIVSGRNLTDLARLSRAPVGTILVGSHGAERGIKTADGVDRQDLELSDGQRSLLARLADALDEIAGRHSGVWVEHKPTAVVLHTRLSTHDGADQAREAAFAAGARLGARVLDGKDVVELSVTETSKGVAIDELRQQIGAQTVVYLGDDITDEHAFAVLSEGDIGIKVGPGNTIAPFRVADTTAAARALSRIVTSLSRKAPQRRASVVPQVKVPAKSLPCLS